MAAARWSGEEERKAKARRRVGRRRHMTGGAARVEGLGPEAEPFLCGRRSLARSAGGLAAGPISRNNGERGWAVGKGWKATYGRDGRCGTKERVGLSHVAGTRR